MRENPPPYVGGYVFNHTLTPSIAFPQMKTRENRGRRRNGRLLRGKMGQRFPFFVANLLGEACRFDALVGQPLLDLAPRNGPVNLFVIAHNLKKRGLVEDERRLLDDPGYDGSRHL